MVIEQLRQTKEETLRYFDLPEPQLDKTYGEGKWSVRYILNHLADAETVLYDRIRRVISEPRGVVWAFDQEAWASKLDYARVPVALSRNIFASVREAVIFYAQAHYDQNGHLEFIHSETGLRRLKDEFDKIALHNANHLAQIRKALQ